MKKFIKHRNYLIIVIYGLLILFLSTGIGNLFGSETDWVGQHTSFPDTFRQNFYQTDRILPNFVFEIGGGQNVFNFSYYGLLSPIFLISYFFPFVDMMSFTCIMGVLTYLADGILVYVFFKRHFSDKNSLFSALVALSFVPLIVYSRYHIMFVWYLPFLLLSLIGIDRYFEKKRSLLFIISTVCIIMTNYYFSVGCLICLFIYAIYNILNDDTFTWKVFTVKVLRVSVVFIVPVLLCAFFLLPTAASLMSGSRPFELVVELKQFIFPKLGNLFYSHAGCGLTGTMLVSLVCNIFAKKRSKRELFLNCLLLLMAVSPLVAFVLNGALYIDGKVLIPFFVLYLYCFVLFVQNIKEGNVNIKYPVIFTAIFAVVCYLVQPEKQFAYLVVLAELLLLVFFYKKRECVFALSIAFMVFISFSSNVRFASFDFVESIHIDETKRLLEHADDSAVYRTNVSYMDKYTCNRTYGDNYYGVSSYASTPNRYYLDFYENNIGNNISVTNSMMVTGSRNEMFYNFMGTRYLVSGSDPGFSYELVCDGEHLNLYESKTAYPLAYKSKKIVSESEFDKQAFPYNVETIMKNTVIDVDNIHDKSSSQIIKYNVSCENYIFENEEEKEYSIELDEKFRNKVLYLTFSVDHTEKYKEEGRRHITINGVSNMLNNIDSIYYNNNTRFEYVISMEDTTTLDITVSKGKFNIYDIEMYYSDLFCTEYQAVNNLVLNEQNDSISCSVESDGSEYLVTSIPYDKGFCATINGEEAEVEIVNKAFVGLKLKNGKNDIVLTYCAPLLKEGLIISLAGFVLLVVLIVFEKKASSNNNRLCE